MPVPGVNVLPCPLASIIFHYSSTLDYRPEFTSMVRANTDDAQVKALRDRYGAQPRALELFAEATYEGRQFNKLVVFDEAYKYIDSPGLVAGLVEVVREMRHKGTSILVASQDPPSVPASLIELSSQIILHKFNSPSWLKHIQKANAALQDLTPAKLAALGRGDAYVWSSKATDEAFTRNAVKIRCRPRVTQHGGATKTALAPDTDDELRALTANRTGDHSVLRRIRPLARR